MRGKKRGLEDEKRKFTVFVNNIPQTLDPYGLKGIFQKVGTVSDSFISFRKSRTNTRFDFERFRSWYDTIRSTHLLNNEYIRGNRIHVCMARFEKN